MLLCYRAVAKSATSLLAGIMTGLDRFRSEGAHGASERYVRSIVNQNCREANSSRRHRSTNRKFTSSLPCLPAFIRLISITLIDDLNSNGADAWHVPRAYR